MEVVAILNQKGGVGKTSATHHLSGSLAIGRGLRVLVIDTDPQASLTQGWWGPIATRELDPGRSVAAILNGSLPDPGDVIHATNVPGISIVPGSRVAGDYNHSKPLQLDRETWETVREFRAEIEGRFDVVLIDCPPNLYGCSFAALAAADWLVVPVQPEDYGAQGIADVLESLASVNELGYPVQLLGLLLTLVQPRKAIHQHYEGMIRGVYGADVFAARFPDMTDYPESLMARKLIQQYKPKGAATKAVRAIADEMLERISTAAVEGQGVAA